MTAAGNYISIKVIIYWSVCFFGNVSDYPLNVIMVISHVQDKIKITIPNIDTEY